VIPVRIQALPVDSRRGPPLELRGRRSALRSKTAAAPDRLRRRGIGKLVGRGIQGTAFPSLSGRTITATPRGNHAPSWWVQRSTTARLSLACRDAQPDWGRPARLTAGGVRAYLELGSRGRAGPRAILETGGRHMWGLARRARPLEDWYHSGPTCVAARRVRWRSPMARAAQSCAAGAVKRVPGMAADAPRPRTGTVSAG
jgi:hypothetical protein